MLISSGSRTLWCDSTARVYAGRVAPPRESSVSIKFSLADRPMPMQCTNLSEADARALVRFQALSRSAPPDMIVEEFWLPPSNRRADVALLGSSIEGIELKTHRDNLKRLSKQAEAYGSVFDKCTLVAAERHLDSADGLLPAWWGLVRLPHFPNGSLEVVRAPRSNPSVDASALVRLLWKEEARNALSNLGMSVEANRGRSWMWEQLQSRTSVSQLRQLVRSALVGRDPTRAKIPTKRYRQCAGVAQSVW